MDNQSYFGPSPAVAPVLPPSTTNHHPTSMNHPPLQCMRLSLDKQCTMLRENITMEKTLLSRPVLSVCPSMMLMPLYLEIHYPPSRTDLRLGCVCGT